LETLSAFYAAKTLAKTAVVLKTTQPTISRRFHDLESLSPVSIFETRGRKKILTDFGQALARLASQRLSGIAVDINSLSNEYKKPFQYHLTVSGRSELLRAHLAKMDLPAALTLIASTSTSASASIRACAYDIVLSQENIETSFYARKRFIKERWFLAIPQKFGTFSTAEKWKAHANRFPYACYDSSNRYLDRIIDELSLPQRPDARFEFSDWGAVAERIALGLNWGILPESFLPNPKLVQSILFENVAPTVFYIYFKTHLRKQAWFVSWLEKQQLS
jgi:DNA-binding transcriptional LysR family regulator